MIGIECADKTMIRKRIGDIELRKIDNSWEIVKWSPNPFYGKENDFIKIDDNQYRYKDKDNCFVNNDCFKNPAYCYVIAFLEGSEYEPDIRSVGMRAFELNEEDEKNFKKILESLFDNENRHENGILKN